MSDKIKFKSGATSSLGHDAPYQLMTRCGMKRGALRFGAGNAKHEDGNTVLAEANWLKAFHARDADFFRNRYTHARDHMDDEMQGIRDADPGGNWGAVVWFAEVMSFVEDHDPEFYNAIIGISKYPGDTERLCTCDRCPPGGRIFGESSLAKAIEYPTIRPETYYCQGCTKLFPRVEICTDDGLCFMCHATHTGSAQ